MKRIFSLLAAVMLVASVSVAQDINFSSAVPIYPIPFTQSELDTLKSTDSSLVLMRMPFNFQVRNIQVITPVLADTGAAASAAVITLWKRTGPQGTPTVVTSATVVEVNVNYTGTPATTALARFAQGEYLELGAILGSNDQLAGATVMIWGTRY